MTQYVILDSTANLVESFDSEDEARQLLMEIVRQDPDSADEYALIPYDDEGHPTGQALTGAEIAAHV